MFASHIARGIQRSGGGHPICKDVTKTMVLLHSIVRYAKILIFLIGTYIFPPVCRRRVTCYTFANGHLNLLWRARAAKPSSPGGALNTEVHNISKRSKMGNSPITPDV